MATTPMNRVIQHLVAACGRDGGRMTDGELLTRFLSGRDDDAFAALIGRHGPMVWGVCCRLLHNPHDAEDAFQATFLVLVQKAATLPNRETVGNWLYGVAHQTAVRMRAIAAKRGRREAQVAAMPEPATAEQYIWNELLPVLDEELSRLPDKYRVLIVLCDLEGVTRKEVARRLDIPEGTAASRLAAARAMLAKRLARRGIVMSGVLLGNVLSQESACASVPALLVSNTMKVASLTVAGQAAGVVSAKVAALTEGVVKAMFMTKIKSVLAVVLVVGLLAGATGIGVFGGGTAAGQEDKRPTAEKAADPATTPANKDKEDDKLKPVMDVERLQGGWRIIACEREGKPVEDGPNGNTVTFDGDKYTIRNTKRTVSESGTFRLASEKTPKQIDMTARDADQPTLGIYKIDGDKLRYCYGGKARPKEFTTTPGSGHTLLVLQKEPFTAWGKEVGGLQAGLGYRPGEHRAYHPGETVKLVLRVRNVGKEAVEFKHILAFFIENPPKITDADGKIVQLPNYRTRDRESHLPRSSNMLPGKEVELYEWTFDLGPNVEHSSRSFIPGTGRFSLQCDRIVGPTWLNSDHPNPTLDKLATGKLELEVKDAKKLSDTLPKEPLTSWGKEVGGLQAGLGYEPGEKRIRLPGETVQLVVRVRNVGKEEVSFQYLRHFFIENPPTVTDDKGKAVALKDGSAKGIYKPEDVTLAPGKEIELYKLGLTLSDKATDTPQNSTLYGEGKFQLQYERVLGDSSLSSVSIKTAPALRTLATGKLDLVVSRWLHLTGAGLEKEEPGKKVNLLQGEWAVTAWQEEGENANAGELKGKKFVIKGGVMSGVEAGIGGSMSFKLNPEKTPNEIDLTVLDGKRKGITEPGIYKIEGDQLRICFGGKVRPTEFTTTPGSGHTLLTLQKEPLTAWGKEAGGLQAGLSISNTSDVQIGGKATVVIKLRNVGKDPITASAWSLWLIKPTIVDGAGKQVRTTSPSSPGFDLSATDITLKPGQTVVVATNNIFVVDADAKGNVRHEGVADQFTIHVRPGKYSVALKGFLEGRPTVATGTVDFEVKADKTEQPNGPATKPNNGPAKEEKPEENPLEPAAKQELPVTKEEKLRVLIDKVLAAHGGEGKLNKLTSFTMTYKYSSGERHQYFIQQPQNCRLETTHQDQTKTQIVIVFPNGRRWWTKEPKEEPKEFVPTGAEITNEFWLDHVKFFGPRQVLRLKDTDHKVALLDEEVKIGDRPAVGVRVSGPHYKHTMYFDKESHLLVQGVGSDVLREVVFSDYKKFDGIPIARKENDGFPVVVEVADFKVEEFDAKLFEIPQKGKEGP